MSPATSSKGSGAFSNGGPLRDGLAPRAPSAVHSDAKGLPACVTYRPPFRCVLRSRFVLRITCSSLKRHEFSKPHSFALHRALNCFRAGTHLSTCLHAQFLSAEPNARDMKDCTHDVIPFTKIDVVDEVLYLHRWGILPANERTGEKEEAGDVSGVTRWSDTLKD